MGKKKHASPIVPAGPPPSPAISKRQLKAQRRQQRQEAVAAAAPEAQSQQEPPAVAPTPPAPDQLQAADDRCWDPEIAHSVSASAPSVATAAAEPLAREVARGAALRRLRLGFSEAVRGLQLTSPLVGAFERWHFGWLLGAAALDPLLPAAVAQPAADADAALRDELVDAGASSEAASAAVAALRASAEAEAAAMAAAASSASARPAGDDVIELSLAPDNSSSGGGGKVWHVACAAAPGPPLKVSDEWLAKLRAMHARAHPEAASDQSDERAFRVDLVRLLLRYKAIGGSGFQAALGGGTFEVLRSYFGASVECCASPLNARSAPFCSAFFDVDAPFGSLGSFLELSPMDGAYEANPPFVPLLIAAMTTHMEKLLRRAEAGGRALLFAVVVGTSAALKRHAAWAKMQRVAKGAFGRAQWLLPLHAHGYTEGHAHIARGGSREARRMSSCDTTVFIWATTAAAARWPASAEAEAAVRAAMRAMVPKQLKRATKANKSAALAKKQKRGV